MCTCNDKICSKCNKLLNINEFYKKQNQCKSCAKLYRKQYYLNNRESTIKKVLEYTRKNPELCRNARRKHYYSKKGRPSVIPPYKEKSSKHNWHNRKEYVNAYYRRLRKEDPVFKLKSNLRRRLGHVLKKRAKVGSAVADLGCTGIELKLYLESLFQLGMHWGNYGRGPGNWSIDHIYPLSKVNLMDREQFLKVSHYTNLRPLWHIDNISKKAIK